MLDVPTCGAVAEYRGCRLKIQFGGGDWIAVRPPSGLQIPDALGKIDSGRADLGQLVKLPMSALDGIIDVVASAKLAGHTVSLRKRLPDGRILVEFVGSPEVARELDFDGDQYMGWTGLVEPDALEDIHVEETRRV